MGAPLRLAPLGLMLATALLVACGGDGGDANGTAEGGVQQFERPHKLLGRGEHATAVVDTSEGTFEIGLDTERSPKTTNSFGFLADRGFYDGLTFHRIVPGFVIQGGDPTGTGTGGPGYSVDEPPPPRTEYLRGTVAMAKTSVEPPGRSGSQFFVVTAADAGLAPQYALLGKVTKGYATVERISELGDPASGQEGTPLEEVTIEGVRIRRR
jgi:peptidyl-prolyl cis-trans isomerase B (cyclophilin B)